MGRPQESVYVFYDTRTLTIVLLIILFNISVVKSKWRSYRVIPEKSVGAVSSNSCRVKDEREYPL